MLKKQSQFSARQKGVSSYMEGCYGNIPPCGALIKQSQIKPICWSGKTSPSHPHPDVRQSG